MEKEIKHISKFMSLVLRHKPETIGLVLNEQGSAYVDVQFERMTTNRRRVDERMLETIVTTNNKQSFVAVF